MPLETNLLKNCLRFYEWHVKITIFFVDERLKGDAGRRRFGDSTGRGAIRLHVVQHAVYIIRHVGRLYRFFLQNSSKILIGLTG